MALIACAGHTSEFETGQKTPCGVVLTDHKGLSACKQLLILTLGTTVFSQRETHTVTRTLKILTHTHIYEMAIMPWHL